jgi:hypothetical protein
MISTAANKGQYFSVKYNCTIDNQAFRPAVCYRLTGSLQKTIEEMAAKDLAKFYPEEVCFVSGAAYPVKRSGVIQVKDPVPNDPVPQVAAPAAAKPGKGSGSRKGNYTQQGKRDFF